MLKPGGRVVLSFLEFANPGHWPVFEQAVRDASGPSTLVQFMSREGIRAWASHLGFGIEAMLDGDQPTIALPSPVVLERGEVFQERGAFGQSVCILSLPTG